GLLPSGVISRVVTGMEIPGISLVAMSASWSAKNVSDSCPVYASGMPTSVISFCHAYSGSSSDNWAVGRISAGGAAALGSVRTSSPERCLTMQECCHQ
ncbi:hypothetical protein S245_070080, partial [Arachis hypogaea]